MSDEFQPIERDALLSLLQQMLPKPVTVQKLQAGGDRLIGGEPEEIVVDVGTFAATVSEYMFSGQPGRQRLRPRRIGSIRWDELPQFTTRRILQELVAAGALLRRDKYRHCKRCDKLTPPERLSASEICRSCEEQDAGLVY